MDHQRKPKTLSLLSCFGYAGKQPSDKKPRKPNSRKTCFRICLPKLIISSKKRKVNLHTKEVDLKASKIMMVETYDQIHPLRLQNDGPNAQHDQPKDILKDNIDQDHTGLINQSDDDTCHRQNKIKSESNSKIRPDCKGIGRLITTNATRDYLMGVTIIVVTTIIMSIWGRICAILCMCAWFYCVPILRQGPARNNTNFRSNNKDTKSELDSELYKKKVVLEGFLQRDHYVAKVDHSLQGTIIQKSTS